VSRAPAEPRLWRKNRDGKAYGVWWATVNKVDVNLNTKNAEIARARLPEAIAGKRKGWPSDVELAARAMESPPPAAAAAAPTGAPAPGQAAPSSSAGAPEAPPVAPDAVLPPPAPTVTPEAPRPALPPLPSGGTAEQEARAEADATNAAAAETAGKAANDNAGEAGEGPAFAMGADAIRGMLGQAAQAIVEIQLGMQAWLVFKRTGKIAPPIDPNSPIRGWAADAWVAQFEKWFPDMGDVPPWIFAVGLPAMALPAQFMGAQPPPPPNQQENGPEAPPAPTSPPTEQAAA